MTALHVLVLVAGFVAAIAAADVLGHRGIGAWPVGLLALALIPVAGYFVSAWIAALDLGIALGALVMLVAARVRETLRHRAVRRAAREARGAVSAQGILRRDSRPKT